MAIRGAKMILALKGKRAREGEGKFLLEGVRLCEEALPSPEVEQVIYAREAAESERLVRLIDGFRQRGVTVQETDRRALQAFCEAVNHQGVVAVVRKRRWDEDLPEAQGPVVVLDRMRDPGNVGMILRTAEAAGASALFLTAGTVELHNPKAVRASAGAILRLPAFERAGLPETLARFRERGYRVLATDVRSGTPYRDLPPCAKVLLLLGSEAAGLDDQARALVDEVAHIPMRGSAESLNVAVAAGILLFHLRSS
jgi:RNA methyltransferase, TrmH family